MPVAGNGNENIGNEWFCVVLEISLPVIHKGPLPFVFFLNVIHVFASLFGEIEICQKCSFIPVENNNVPGAQKRL